ncbi:hypothetical membrane associated protein [Streptococcus pyogenes]|uniref:hypothetical protein n=1 Tax=Streptococcus pyogenes TaxID=1314 RepID=UPI0010A1CF46|nr:hypothetical protein [Streptococcus pyogenes]VGQ87186.1 hypothetical membrane associated protein [Streptococcus pyogenes]VGR54030.1 hypothetical membrane associated protein [Streptococcus pyogenes]VGR83390.1 hypothetical membrane associated protein [Streptococcus pyogenes]VGY12284.1 Uncharacterised protein [Streptococcus pyogenes]VGY61872.1 Uncharacterised protein [Streptococcus pyogenes]
MKTKSKRFLNLATLCLALLGTTLLMEQPVKAEAVAVKEVQQIEENAEDSDIKREYMDRLKITNSDLEEQEHLKNRVQGYLSGYKEGFRGSTRPETEDIPIPDGFEGDTGDYKDGYEEGFGEGRRKNYPVQAFLEEVWGFLTEVFGSWFGSGNSSQ